MKTTNGEVMFCPGCPSQGEFVDIITEETAVADHTFDTSRKGDIDLRVELTFVDQDGGVSGPTNGYIYKRRLDEVGLKLRRRDNGYLVDQARIERSVERGMDIVKTTMVERIGRCASGASGMDCPAMGKQGAFNKILDTSFANRNKKK